MSRKRGTTNNNNNGEKSKNKPPKNPPKSLDALKARLEATKSKVSSKSNKERESETLGFIGEKETSGVPPTPGALLGGQRYDHELWQRDERDGYREH